MRNRRIKLITGALILFSVAGCFLFKGYWDPKSPLFFRGAISAFEEADAQNPPAKGQILFVGSSSFRFWRTLETDMAPLPVLNRGFGGSMMDHVNYYFERVVLPYEPALIVVYEGDNDLAAYSDKSVDEVMEDFTNFSLRVFKELPETKILFVSIKPSKARWDRWGLMNEANERLAAFAGSHPMMAYVDAASVLLNEAGEPNDDYFISDDLHLNKQGYAIWAQTIKPAVMAMFQPQ